MTDGAAASPMESRLRVHWLDAGLRRPLVNCVLLDPAGRFLAQVDLFDEESGLVGEFDGVPHASSARRRDDALRRERLERRGLTLRTFTGVDVYGRPEALYARLHAARAIGLARDWSADRWRVVPR